MTFSFEIPLLILLIMTAAGAILVKDLVPAVFILGSYSFFLALVWAWYGAVDVAFVEAVVGAGLATVFFLLTLFGTAPKDTRIRRPPPPWAALIGLPLLGFLLLYGPMIFPNLGIQLLPRAFIFLLCIWRTVCKTRIPPMWSPRFSWTTALSTP